jgi:hypothetical protein
VETLGERTFAADVFPLRQSPLQAVILYPEQSKKDPKTKVPRIVVRRGPQSLEGLGGLVYERLLAPLGERVFTRRMVRAYVDNAVVIVKPAQRRYWTEAAALHDADSILAEDLRLP